MKKFFQEFKAFAMRGNVLDMAVGLIVGSAFTSIVSSLVKDIFTPLINLLTGQLQFTDWVIPLGTSEIYIGNFVQSVFNFLLTAFCIFLIVRFINHLRSAEEKRKNAGREPEPAKEPEPPKEEQLLTEIRDLLKAQQEGDTQK